jgi:methionyl aminopeptidase
MYYPYQKFEKNFLGVNKITTDVEIPIINGNENNIESLLKGGKIHFKVRKEIQKIIKPGLSLKTLANTIESNIVKFTNGSGMNNGIGFPSSLSVTNCVAHYTPADRLKDVILNYNDNIKIDFGVVVNGWIVDCAFSAYFDKKFDNLHKAVKDATYNGLKTAGEDVLISDWSKGNQEIMESYEIEDNGKIYPIKAIRNLGGHNIKYGKIHGGEFLPCVYNKYNNNRFREGVYAIETFGTYNDNLSIAIEKEDENSIYMWNFNNYKKMDKIFEKKNTPFKIIDLTNKMKKQFKTLPFCNRFIKKIKPDFKKEIEYLNKINILKNFPPLYSKNMSAQYEHTIVLKNYKKIIVSQFEDY